jgi:oligosaccharide reducing-end xylanase
VVGGNRKSAGQYRVLGSVSDESDLSATFRVLWSESGLFVLVEVTDDATHNGSSTDYENDCVELYIDGTNGKATSYTATDRQYRFTWNSTTIYEKGDNTTGVELAQSTTADGYRMEIFLPWSSVGTTPSAGDFIGLDVHVGDNDGSGREGKLAWAATGDDAWQDPSVFGTARLSASTVQSAPRAHYRRTAGEMRVRIAAGRVLIDMGAPQAFSVGLYDGAGRLVRVSDGNASHTRIPLDGLCAGVYILNLHGNGVTRWMRVPVRR